MQRDWREDFSAQGYVICKNILPPDLIDDHVKQVAALCTRYGVVDTASLAALPIETDDQFMQAMLDLHYRNELARKLIFNRIMRHMLSELFGDEPILSFARSSLWEPGNMRAHVDTAFRSPDAPYSVCRTWCALEDIDPESGRFYLIPGSHRTLVPRLCDEVLEENPELLALSQKISEEPASWWRLFARGWPKVNAKVPERIDGNAKLSFDMKKGDVIFFNPALVHGTVDCLNSNGTRKVMICEWTTRAAWAASGFSRPFYEENPAPSVEEDKEEIEPLIAARVAVG
ncbi:phytanoyl-CoA dioxygenase family protein [Beijerinckia indica]|uniref:Phytanoyl-CoA dioxygenase n=1 Tax=Beijerinckia indica subsp. indica (strain ATCC 9039 / DSM 1715 / NCIMB 8712) TaxID=395963 RepID=B2IH18_BEII9|nr:phytanoyl-CoA dioxygenase family protein [Beijerinckia indica]ACB94432.1 Phytanoyl-CoA dioxygenase [Beijerinckia indica subsp. indica ATCC 9039]